MQRAIDRVAQPIFAGLPSPAIGRDLLVQFAVAPGDGRIQLGQALPYPRRRRAVDALEQRRHALRFRFRLHGPEGLAQAGRHLAQQVEHFFGIDCSHTVSLL